MLQRPKELGKNHPPQSRRTQKNERITPGAHAGPSRNLARNCSPPAPLPGRGFWGGAASRGPQKKRSPLVSSLHSSGAEDSRPDGTDRKSTRLNSSHGYISYAVFCLKKKKQS